MEYLTARVSKLSEFFDLFFLLTLIKFRLIQIFRSDHNQTYYFRLRKDLYSTFLNALISVAGKK